MALFSRLHAGKGMFRRIRGQQDQWAVDEQWLESLQVVDLPPVDTLMHSCLLQPIQEQVRSADWLMLMLAVPMDIPVVPLWFLPCWSCYGGFAMLIVQEWFFQADVGKLA